VIALALASTPSPEARPRPAGHLTATQFAALMEKIATGWNQGNAQMAADCFSEDAIYSSPPSGKLRRGRKHLFEFFGGATGRPAPMHMEWHHFAYEPDTEIGFGEYTFRYKGYQAHGIVIVRTRNGEIRNWREYDIPSKLTFEQFVGANAF
jgi:ketosteroid isomerase-like protein